MLHHILSVIVLLLAAGVSAAQTAPSRVMIIVLDTSGSMQGERINSAKKEILAVARQSPPSKDQPILLVPFAGSPHLVATFTDLPSLEAHLKKIEAVGSTNIAAALHAGLEQLKPYTKAAQLCFLFYSDGEDTDSGPAAIAAAEQKLDALFTARSKQGLQNMLFCKRWDNAQAKLLADLAMSGHTQVIDAKELTVVPVTVNLTVQVMRATWAKDTPFVLEIEGQARLDLKGLAFDPSIPTGIISCTDPGSNLKPVALRPGDPKPAPFTMRLPLTPAIAGSGKTTLHFVLGPVGQFPEKTGIVLPLISDRIAVPVTLPPIEIRCTLSASLTPAKPAIWSDALTAKPAQEFLLTCSVRSVPDGPWPGPLTIHLEPENCRLLAGKDTLEFGGADSVSLPVTLESNSVTAGTPDFSIALMLRPDLPAGFTMNPPHVRLTSSQPIPKTVETQITTQIQECPEARWTDLAQGIAAFHADITFTVSGPVPSGARLVLVCPPTIRTIDIQPSVLHTGSQTVRLTIHARFPAAPSIAQFEIQVQPPPVTGAVRFLPPAPLRLRVPGPSPVQLVMLSPDGASPTVTVRERTGPVMLTGIPVLLDFDAKLGSGLFALVHSGPLLGSQKLDFLPLNTPMMLPVSLPTETSFFFDTTFEEEVEILPSPPSPALIGSRQRVSVTVEAPFKRIFFYVVASLSVILIVVLIVRALTRLSSPGSDHDPTNPGGLSDDHLA